MLDDMFKKLTEAESRYEEALNDYKNAPRGNNLIDRHIVITLQDAEENYKDVLEKFSTFIESYDYDTLLDLHTTD